MWFHNSVSGLMSSSRLSCASSFAASLAAMVFAGLPLSYKVSSQLTVTSKKSPT